MKRLLAALTALAFVATPARSADDSGAAVAPTADSAPPVVLVLRQTERGRKIGVLEGLGIRRYGRSSKTLVENLERALDRTNVYAPFLAPTICPGARVDGACPAVRMIDDVKLPEAIKALQPARIVLLRPYIVYYDEARSFFARFVVDLLDEGGRRMNTFAVSYYDWSCDVPCVQTSYPAAASELAAMFRYMLELDIGYRTRAMPNAWRDKSQLKDFAPWSNECVIDTDTYRIVRKYGERLWLYPTNFNLPQVVALVSLSWRGCNTVDGL